MRGGAVCNTIGLWRNILRESDKGSIRKEGWGVACSQGDCGKLNWFLGEENCGKCVEY